MFIEKIDRTIQMLLSNFVIPWRDSDGSFKFLKASGCRFSLTVRKLKKHAGSSKYIILYKYNLTPVIYINSHIML